jgi:hypothetical protein
MIEVASLQGAFFSIDVCTAIPRGAIVNFNEATMMGGVFEGLDVAMSTMIVQAASSSFS